MGKLNFSPSPALRSPLLLDTHSLASTCIGQERSILQRKEVVGGEIWEDGQWRGRIAGGGKGSKGRGRENRYSCPPNQGHPPTRIMAVKRSW